MADWDSLGTSGDVEDRRGMNGGLALAGGGGIVVLLITLGLNFLGFQVDPSTVSEVVNSVDSVGQSKVSPEDQPPEFRGLDDYEKFTSTVLGSTNKVWGDIFTQSGKTYREPKLVLFRQATQSGCGIASSEVGPHYCPNDNTIYMDETFFDEMKTKLGADMHDVAQAYVIAHEVGHNVQNQLGAIDQEARLSGEAQQQASIQLELQADCYAGVWAHAVSKLGIFDNGDIQQAMDAAAAVGDDRIQQAATGSVDKESWTHGSSEQRQGAFSTGYTSGQPGQCKDF